MKVYYQRCLYVFDVIISLLWVSHLTITFWRGTWNLIDVYVLPGRLLLSSIVTAVTATTALSIIKSLMPVFNRHVTKKHRILYTIISRTVSYILAVLTATQWRGIWYLLDIAMDTKWKSNAITLAVTMIIMWLCQTSVTIVYNPPMIISYDEMDNFFYSEGRVKVKASKPILRVMDICFYQCVIGSLVISAWRAIWNIYNDIILPDNFLLSNLLTHCGGLILCLLVVIIQKPVAQLSIILSKTHWILKLLLHQVYIIPAIFGVIAMWRGWWNILEGILLPDLVVGGWICHVVGVMGLLLTGMMSSLYDMSCQTDGNFLEDFNFWPMQFLQIIFIQKSQSEKEKEKSSNLTENPLQDQEVKLDMTDLIGEKDDHQVSTLQNVDA